MDLALQRRLYQACDPAAALDPDDPRNVDLDGDDGGQGVRGDRWAESIADEVSLGGEHPTLTLFTGLPGSGKTTELRRIKARLARGSEPLLAVIIDAADSLSLSDPVDVVDVLAAILQGAERAVLVAEGKDPDAALRDGSMQRLWSWLTKTDVEFSRIEWGYGPAMMGAKLVTELKTRPTVRAQVREIVSRHLAAFVREVHDELEALSKRVQRVGEPRWRGMVVILDSLERVHALSDQLGAVLQAAERLFSAQREFLRLPVHALYTVPPALYLRLRVDVRFLPMIKLADRSGARFAPGYDAARRLIEARVSQSELNELFGAPSRAARVESLIAASGGYPRELVRLLQRCVARHADLSRPGGFERVLSREVDQRRQIVRFANAAEWLARVRRQRDLVVEGDTERALALQMLTENVVLYYLNDRGWFDVHPAVSGMEEVQRELASLERDGGAG